MPGDPSVLSTAPRRSRLEKVAEYLRVSPEWLMTGRDPAGEKLDPISDQLVDIYKQLPADFQEMLMQQANGYLTLIKKGKGPHNPFGKDK